MRTEALDLRKEALDLLRQAQEFDELKPFVVIHGHSNGVSGYVCWANADLSPEKMKLILDDKFKLDEGDLLVIDSNITLNELTAMSMTYCLQEKELYVPKKGSKGENLPAITSGKPSITNVLL